jgi:hypothetical protein
MTCRINQSMICADFSQKMSPEKSAENANWLRDYNGDGSHDWRDLIEVKSASSTGRHSGGGQG